VKKVANVEVNVGHCTRGLWISLLRKVIYIYLASAGATNYESRAREEEVHWPDSNRGSFNPPSFLSGAPRTRVSHRRLSVGSGLRDPGHRSGREKRNGSCGVCEGGERERERER
jgi:hypothetical protein